MKYLCVRTCFLSNLSLYCLEGEFYDFPKDPGNHFKKVGDEEAEEAEEKPGKRKYRKPVALSELAPKAGRDTHEYTEPEKK